MLLLFPYVVTLSYVSSLVFYVTTEVYNTLFCVTMKFHGNALMNMLQESATISLFCSSVCCYSSLCSFP